MPRLSRCELLPDHGFFHVTARGVAETRIYADDRDRLLFLKLLGVAVHRFDVDVDTFCLMDTHYHVIVRAPRIHVSAALHVVNGRYAQAFNRRYSRRGHLFGERFAAWVIETEAHLRAARRYVLVNPLEAGLCDDPALYRWSGSRYGKSL